MSITFDHLVHFTDQPDQARKEFQKLGFQAIKGGNHPNWGTYNSLCYFQNLRYIEWIGFTDQSIAQTSENVLIQQIVEDSSLDGFSQLAFRTDNIDKLKNSLQEKGINTIGPVEGSRKKEDGTVLSWAMLFIKGEDEQLLRSPFFIQWGKDDQMRTEEMSNLMVHSNKASTISYIGFVVKDGNSAIHKYATLLDIPVSVQLLEDSSGFFYELVLKDFSLRFYEPTSPELQKIMEARGERPFICGITSVDQDQVLEINGGLYSI
ncbi:VOC family protein [Bacillus sp. AK128]